MKHISRIPEEDLQHFGVKGMKWGVRKEESTTRTPLKSLGPDKIVRKTSRGEEVTLSKTPPTKLHELLARMSKSYREEYESSAFLDIRDGQGKKVGEAQVQKKSKDELYLIWLGINQSARGRGYGTAVMNAAKEFGKQEGFKKMVLEVPANSKDARHIYGKLGFKYISEANGGNKDAVWGELANMEYDFAQADHADTADRFLEHFGVKGMKWGQRKKESKVTVVTAPGGKIKTSGGYARKPASDAVKAARLRQRAKTSSVKSLSNDELQTLLKRMSLEKQYKDIQGDNAFRRGVKITREILGIGQLGKQVVSEVAGAVKSVKK
jgi:ribosomal protein S18 acetylase RimI-like enzyme